jgi:valyl-tRNA synthetase
MAAMETQGRDINLSDARIAGYRNFATKLWNAARFCEMNECRTDKTFDPDSVKLPVNRWIIAKAKDATADVSKNLNEFRFSDAANAVYQFVWGNFCDWYIELSKPIFYGTDEASKLETRATAAWVLDRILLILHPFMPFVTTQLWNNLAERDVKLIHARWPENENTSENVSEIDWAIDLITALRSLRANMNLPAGAKPTIYLKDASADSALALQAMKPMICSLARLENIELFALDAKVTKDMVQNVFKESVILLPLKGLVDIEAERVRLTKELDNLNKCLAGYERKLSNEAFVAKAPESVVAEEKRRQAEALESKAKTEQALERLKDL